MNSTKDESQRRFTISLDEGTYERLRWLAFRNRRSVSAEAREAVRGAVASVTDPAEGEAES